MKISVTAWLHGHGMTLRDLRQEHLDRRLADGSTHRRRAVGALPTAATVTTAASTDALGHA